MRQGGGYLSLKLSLMPLQTGVLSQCEIDGKAGRGEA
jgi:hypothetical protein